MYSVLFDGALIVEIEASQTLGAYYVGNFHVISLL